MPVVVSLLEKDFYIKFKENDGKLYCNNVSSDYFGVDYQNYLSPETNSDMIIQTEWDDS